MSCIPELITESKAHCLLFTALGSFDFELDVVTILLRTHDFGVELELETLLGENLLELLAADISLSACVLSLLWETDN